MQVWCDWQLTLCDPHLSALEVRFHDDALYKSMFTFTFTFTFIPLSLWHIASAMSDLWLPSQPQSITALWQVPNNTYYFVIEAHVCEQLATVTTWKWNVRESNLRSVDRKSNALTMTQPCLEGHDTTMPGKTWHCHTAMPGRTWHYHAWKDVTLPYLEGHDTAIPGRTWHYHAWKDMTLPCLEGRPLTQHVHVCVILVVLVQKYRNIRGALIRAYTTRPPTNGLICNVTTAAQHCNQIHH